MLSDLFKPQKSTNAPTEAEAGVDIPPTSPFSANKLDLSLTSNVDSEPLTSINQALDDIETEINHVISNGATVDIYNKSVIIKSAIAAARRIAF